MSFVEITNENITKAILTEVLLPIWDRLKDYTDTTVLWLNNYVNNIVNGNIKTNKEIVSLFKPLQSDLSIYLYDYDNYDLQENNVLNNLFSLVESGNFKNPSSITREHILYVLNH